MTCAPRGISSTYSASVGRPRRGGAAATSHGDPFGLADDVVVLNHAGVRVELPAGGERDEVTALLGVDSRTRSPGREGRVTRAVRPRSPATRYAHRLRRSSGCATERQNAHSRPGVGEPHEARLQRFALLVCDTGEALVAAFEEPEDERRLRARRPFLDRVQRLLVAEVPIAGRHRALLDDVVDARRGRSRPPSPARPTARAA